MAAGLLSLLGPAGLSFLPSLISAFAGDPQKKLRRKANQLISPQNQAATTNAFYQQALGSPAYAQAQGTIAAGANTAGADLARAIGAAGIGSSGSGAILSSLMPSLVGSQQAGLRTSAYQGAQQQAQNQIQQQLQLLMGTSGPSQTQQLFGTGLEAFQPFLQQYFRQRFPQMFGGVPGLPQNALAGALAGAPSPTMTRR